MSETMPLPLPELPDPNIRPGEEAYIQNPEQAEVMAYASKAAEEASVSANNAAAETMSHYGEGSRIDDWRVNRQANRQFNAAENARATADSHADAAAETFTKFGAATGTSAREDGPDTREQNAEKAEIMAYASKDKEEAAVQARTAGLEAAMNVGDKKWRSNQPEAEPEAETGAEPKAEQNLTVTERFKARAKKMGKEALRMAGLSQERSAKQEVSHQTKIAQKAREAANKQADAAAKVYDRFDQPSAPSNLDPRRAELMDSASRAKEEMAAHARELGLDAATRLGEGGLSGLAAKAEIAYHTKAYERAKAASSKKAAAAGKAYDRANKFRTRDHYRPAA